MTIILVIILATVGVLLARYLINRAKSSPTKMPTGQQIALGSIFVGIVLALALLAFRGAVHWLAPLIGGLTPLIIRLIPWLARRFKAGSFGTGPQSQGRTSEVNSPWLRMTLDLDSGHMEGEVLLGEHSGRFLSEMSRSELLSLRRAMKDGDSLRLLDTWLDRNHADWRDAEPGHEEGETNSGPQGDVHGTMTRDEALRVLGLAEGAENAEIRAAYKQLMQKLHPDLGGSDYLAAVVNRAKEVLLKD